MKYFHHAFKAMGTPCEIQLFAGTDTEAERAVTQTLADVQRLEQRYSRYREDSYLSAINRVAAAGGCITVDAETAGLLDYAAACHQQSQGLFDITSGVLRKAWRFDQHSLPTDGLIDALQATVGWRRLHWQAPVLEFSVPGMEIDFGGIVKEYAVDRAASLCWAAGIRHGVVNLGGDIKVIGPRADGSPWRIGIRDPRNPDAVLVTLTLTGGALASSGDYERCVVVNGVRYGHVLNPKTGWPVRHLTAVSVIADFCVVAGSAATIAMLKEEQGADWLTQLGLPCCWVDAAGRTGGPLLS